MDINSIGEAAGKLWMVLGAQKRVAIGSLGKALGGDIALAHQAVGWLARESKVEFETQGRQLFVKLTDSEAEEFRKSSGR
jgi:hypothetical protein